MKRNKLFLKVYGEDRFVSLDYITSITLSSHGIQVISHEHGHESSFSLDPSFHSPTEIKNWMEHLIKEK